MNRQELEGNWKQMKGRVKEKWGKLTDDDLDQVEGRQQVLVGILTLSDVREAKPSDATTLSIWELNYLWDQLTVERTMTRPVISTTANAHVIDAVSQMLDHKFSGLPVVDDANHVVGFLSQIDVYRLLVAAAERERVSGA